MNGDNMKLAWIGTGVMGKAMLLHLVKGGHEVSAYNRTLNKAAELRKHGVAVYENIRDCVNDADIVFSMVGYPKDVEDIYFRKDGIFQHMKKGAVAIDMTTSSPALAKRLYTAGKAYGIEVMDAPVSGGDTGAVNASLSIMAGGDQDTFEKIKDILSLMGNSIHFMGEAGSGQHAKAANQIAVAGAVAAMTEAIHYARLNHMDEQLLLQAIRGGAAGSWQLEHTAARVLKQDFAPGFYIRHFIKDMHIIQDVMNDKKERLHMLDTVCDLYEQLEKEGLENEGTQALIKYYEK